MAAKAKASKRELIDTGNDKRYVRRDEKGQFDKVVDVERSLGQSDRTSDTTRRRKFRRVRATAAIKSKGVKRSAEIFLNRRCDVVHRREIHMKKVIATIGLTGALLILSCEPLLASTQQNRNASNRNTSIKNEMKQSGKQVTEAGKSLGHNVKHGRVARGGKHFGKHIYSAGKHFGKGSGMAAKKTGRAVKNAAKP